MIQRRRRWLKRMAGLPGAAGGPIDALSRINAGRLQKRWGQSVIVDPKSAGADALLL